MLVATMDIHALLGHGMQCVLTIRARVVLLNVRGSGRRPAASFRGQINLARKQSGVRGGRPYGVPSRLIGTWDLTTDGVPAMLRALKRTPD